MGRLMRPCIVISTVGRTENLQQLLDSLVNQSDSGFVVGICDQSTDLEVARVVAEYQTSLQVFITKSGRGLSKGRNSVISRAPADTTHFLFPNDTSTLPQNLIRELKERHVDSDVVAMTYVDDHGPRYIFDEGDAPLTKKNVWKIIEAATVLSSRLVNHVGGFDEGIGTGSNGPWQSGEGTDVLLKAMGMVPQVAWNPTLEVHGVTQDFQLSKTQKRTKLRAYGRGYGYIQSRWNYSVLYRVKSCLGPLYKAVLAGRFDSMADALYEATGRFEGIIGGMRR